MEHIIKRHVLPVKLGKSYFLSRDVTYISNIIAQTISNPDQLLPHRDDVKKEIYKKVFPMQIGIHGINGKPCYAVTCVVKAIGKQLVTAYPTLK